MQIELRHLRVIGLIADVGTLSGAAAVLGVPQPSVTAQLRRIEETLGNQLFVRSRTGVTSTEFGEFVIAQSRRILQEVDSLLADAKARSLDVCPIRIGGTPGVIFSSAAETLESLSDEHPVIARAELDPVKLVEMFSRRNLDGAIFMEFPRFPLRLPEGVERVEISSGPEFVVLPERHPLAGEPEVTLSELRDEKWVLPPACGNGYRAFLRQVFEEAGINLRVTYEIADTASAMEIVLRGRALGLGPATRRSQPGLVLIPLVGSPLRYTKVLAWWSDGPLARYAEAIAERAREEYRTTALASPVFRDWLRINAIAPVGVLNPWATGAGAASA